MHLIDINLYISYTCYIFGITLKDNTINHFKIIVMKIKSLTNIWIILELDEALELFNNGYDVFLNCTVQLTSLREINGYNIEGCELTFLMGSESDLMDDFNEGAQNRFRNNISITFNEWIEREFKKLID